MKRPRDLADDSRDLCELGKLTNDGFLGESFIDKNRGVSWQAARIKTLAAID
jgi:hypothetical protein